jgi:multidrug resistance efflux pump
VTREARHDHQHEAHLAKARASLSELDAQIQQLQARAEKQAAGKPIEYGNEFGELRKRRDELANRLRELQQTGGDAWKDLLIGLESMRDKLRAAIGRVR